MSDRLKICDGCENEFMCSAPEEMMCPDEMPYSAGCGGCKWLGCNRITSCRRAYEAGLAEKKEGPNE